MCVMIEDGVLYCMSVVIGICGETFVRFGQIRAKLQIKMGQLKLFQTTNRKYSKSTIESYLEQEDGSIKMKTYRMHIVQLRILIMHLLKLSKMQSYHI